MNLAAVQSLNSSLFKERLQASTFAPLPWVQFIDCQIHRSAPCSTWSTWECSRRTAAATLKAFALQGALALVSWFCLTNVQSCTAAVFPLALALETWHRCPITMIAMPASLAFSISTRDHFTCLATCEDPTPLELLNSIHLMRLPGGRKTSNQSISCSQLIRFLSAKHTTRDLQLDISWLEAGSQRQHLSLGKT